MNRDQLLRKIRACLRLATSAGAHEAATALRQAQKLMDAYGISRHEVGDVSEAQVRSGRSGQKLAKSITALARMVARAFRCRIIFGLPVQGNGAVTVTFFGEDASPQVAAYAFDVLRRQMDAERKQHLRRVRVPATREARGEAFAQGWVNAVCDLLPAPPEGRVSETALDAYEQQRWPTTGTLQLRAIPMSGARSESDTVAGWLAGKRATLSQGLRSESTGAAEQRPAPAQLELLR